MKDVRVAVVGGGLAGLAAALECADAGASVTLFESRRRLGGATFSVRRKGYWLDNGQHVALRCCTAYRAFLRRIGVEHHLEIQPRLRIPVLSSDGSTAVLDRTALPPPLHLALTLLRYRHLTIRERLAAVRAARALQGLDPKDRSLDAQTLALWLGARGQSERAISALWNLIALPTLNLDAHEASLLPAVKVFRTGLLDESDACDMALPRIPLQHLHGDPAAAALRARGARIEIGVEVRRVEARGDGFRLDLGDDVEAADVVVLAVPHHSVTRLAPEGVVAADAMRGLGASPIVNVHLHFERRVLFEPFAAALDSPVQWLFDRTASSGVERGQLVSVSLSGAEQELAETQEEIVARVRPAAEELLPAARGAALLDAAVTKEPRATFRATPGTAALRPGTRTEVPGLYLAGAWTDTGWPATMEGAVRSGTAAAQAAVADSARAAQAPAQAVEAAA
jgi:squalene-associated FAD-dependent desaturase